MPSVGMPFPWTYASMPYGTLDLLRGCNVHCPGCYNGHGPRIKPLRQVITELHQMLALRRLHTVALVGGEPTLHPQLVDIVRYIASQGLHVSLLTNGVLLDAALLKRLKAAGLHAVYLHIQPGQQRPDAPDGPTPEQLRALRRKKTALIAAHGLEVGLSAIAYKSRLSDIRELVTEVIESPFIRLLLVTEFTDAGKFAGLTGDVRSGLRGQPPSGACPDGMDAEEVCSQDVLDLMGAQGMQPFAHLGSSKDARDPRWLLYLVGVVRAPDRPLRAEHLRSSLSDRLLIRLPYWLFKRHAAWYQARPAIFRLQLIFNAVSGGAWRRNLRLLTASWQRGAALQHKHLLFQQGPTLAADGEVVFCRDCPDATMLCGRLVPLCLTDRMAEASA